MPKFLEQKLKAEYGNNPHAIYGTMNAIGAMHGNKETEKGREMETKHMKDERSHGFHRTEIEHHTDGSHTVKHWPMAKKSKSGAFHEMYEPTSYSAEDGHELMAKMGNHLGMDETEEEDEEA